MSTEPQPWPEPAPEAVRDRLGELFPDEEFMQAFGRTGPAGWSPGRLALVTVFQTAENLTDRQAAEAVRDRLSRAYALGLEPAGTGLDLTVLSQFRTRVVEHGPEEKALDLLPARLKEQGLVGAGGKQRTDAARIVSAVRDLNRLEPAGRHAAARAPGPACRAAPEEADGL